MADPASKKRKTTSSSSIPSSSFLSKGRHYTLTLALPSTLLTSTSTPLLRSSLAAQIARVCTLNNVDEIVLFDPVPSSTSPPTPNDSPISIKSTPPADHLHQLLIYLCTPTYLLKRLFPLTPTLAHVGFLPPLNLPLHPSATDTPPYRLAMALETAKRFSAGLPHPITASSSAKPGTLVTLRMPPQATYTTGTAEVVPHHTPRTEAGIYTGYTVRLATSLSAVFTEAPWEGGYDASVGCGPEGITADKVELPEFKHLLVAVGGLEDAAAKDASLGGVGAREVFDFWVDPLPGAGCRDARVEEEVWGVLVGLRRGVVERGWKGE